MKICIVSGIFPPDIGGPATYLFNICRELNKLGHKIYVITFGDEYIEFPFPVKRISRRIPPFIRILLAFIEIIKLHRDIDIIFTLGGPWDSGIPGLLAKIILHKPIVTKVTGDIAWERARIKHLIEDDIEQFQIRKYSIKVEFFRWLQSFVVKSADKIIVPSHYLKSIIMGWGIPLHKIEVVYNAIKEEDFRISLSQAEARKKLGLNGKIILLTVARLVPWKGIDLLIQILTRFNKEIQLLVVGDGPEMRGLKELAGALAVDKRVIFEGRIPYNRVGLYLKAADIFVSASSYEGLPHSILEAMIVGIPIVAANTGGIPEIIMDDNGGILFKPGDLLGLKESIGRILEDRIISLKFVESAKEKVKQFNWDMSGERTVEIFDSLTSGRRNK